MSIGKSDPPPAPDYASAAAATAAGNLQNAREATRANRYNEVGPNGSVGWQNDGNGNWTRTTSLAPGQQQLYDTQLGNQQNVAGALKYGGLIKDATTSSADSIQKLSDAMYGHMTRYMQGNFDREQNSLEAKLSAMGLARGTDAWRSEMDPFAQRKDSAYEDAARQATTAAYSQANTNQNSAVNRLTQLMGIASPTTPTSSNTGQMPTIAGADQMGAAQATYGANLDATNVQNANTANTWGTILGGGKLFMGGK